MEKKQVELVSLALNDFSYQEKIFKEIEQEQQFLDILNVEPSILHKDDKLFSMQQDYHKKKAMIMKKAKKEGAEMKEKEPVVPAAAAEGSTVEPIAPVCPCGP